MSEDKKTNWLKDFCQKGFETLPKRARIFKISTADSFDSEILTSLGFNVVDNSIATTDLLTNNLPRKYDGFLCWRVFAHFTKEDLELALNKIYQALNINGRLIFDIDHHEAKLIETISKTNFKIVDLKKFNDKNSSKWFCVVLEKSDKVDQKIKQYINTKILPEYDFYAGHNVHHINYVIRRSLNFAELVPEVNIDMVYVAAAYHDIGRKIDNKHHEIESAKIFLNDDFMKDFFTDSERKLIAEAIEDHRASSDREPRSVYGRIVSSADRSTSIYEVLSRIYKYNKSLHPDYTDDETFADCCLVLRKKYGINGYASSKMFFHDPDYEDFIKEIERITADISIYKKLQLDFNNKNLA